MHSDLLSRTPSSGVHRQSKEEEEEEEDER